MTTKDVDFFGKTRGHIQALHNEISALSKSKPDVPINKFKLGFINEKLRETNTLLKGAYKPFEKFETFDQDPLPTNSDVVLVLSQYLDCLESWRCANIHTDDFNWYWKVDGVSIETERPTRYRKA